MTADASAPPVSADLKALGVEADSLSVPPPTETRTDASGGAAQATAPVQTIAQEWEGGTEMFAAFITTAAKHLKPVWTPERVEELGKALGVVATKRGWRLSAWLLEWGPEFALVCVAVPLLRDSAIAQKEHNEKKAGIAKSDGAGPDATPAASPKKPVPDQTDLVKANQ